MNKDYHAGGLTNISYFYVSLKGYEPRYPFSLGFLVALVQEKVSAKAAHPPAFFVFHSCGRHQTMAPYPLGNFCLTDPDA